MREANPNGIGWVILLVAGVAMLVGLFVLVAADMSLPEVGKIPIAYVGLVLGWLALACLGAWVAAQKGRRPAEGLILGLLFGPLGVLVEGLLPLA